MEFFKSQNRNLEDPVCILFALLEDWENYWSMYLNWEGSSD